PPLGEVTRADAEQCETEEDVDEIPELRGRLGIHDERGAEDGPRKVGERDRALHVLPEMPREQIGRVHEPRTALHGFRSTRRSPYRRAARFTLRRAVTARVGVEFIRPCEHSA